MIASLTGQLQETGQDYVIIDVAGFGIRVSVPASTMARMPSFGETVKLHTHLYMREDQLSIYGFASQEELRLFDLLIAVRQVGPKLALGILSALPADEAESLIAEGNVAALSKIPGLGRKTAERLILELKGKVRRLSDRASGPGSMGRLDVVVDALTGLGYTQAEAQEAARSVLSDGELSDEDAVRAALTYFQR